MAKELIQAEGPIPEGELTDEATLLKKRARRRLIGAAALALLAAIVLPMVMDHQPAPSLKDIQVRIPSPDEGAPPQRVPAVSASAQPRVASAGAVQGEKAEGNTVKPITKALTKPEAKTDPAKPDGVLETAAADKAPEKSAEKAPEKVVATEKPPEKPAEKTVKPAERPALEKQPATEKTATTGESWEVQLGAYQSPGSVTNLVGRLKQLGIPTYTEKVETPAGPRTRVRAGPFPTQEAAEKAKARIKIVGVDGPVARKP